VSTAVPGRWRAAAPGADAMRPTGGRWSAGLGLNALLGWWWADLAMTPLIGREGLEAVQGRTCCDCA